MKKGGIMKTLIVVLTVSFCISSVFSQAKRDDKKVAPQSSPAPKSNEGILWGQTFVDYSYAAQTADATQKGTNAFEFRRIYLGYDQDISEQFTARVLIQANDEDTAKSGAMDFSAQEVYSSGRTWSLSRAHTLDFPQLRRLRWRKRFGVIGRLKK